ncbi:MAG: response regulator, partial [Desulfobacteraceae bacterium]|nr:response regulator [Desulfobacteraceae bacterium]
GETSRPPVVSIVYPTGSEWILLVDDEEAVARMEKQMLERLGYRITTCTSSLDALKTFEADPTAFDLVITDMSMPGMTGDRMARQMMALKPGLPVILCTGFSEQISPQMAASIGINGFLMKPVLLSELAGTVRRLLDKAKKESDSPSGPMKMDSGSSPD